MSVLTLSASLPNLQFIPGKPFSLEQQIILQPSFGEAPPIFQYLIVFMRALIAIGIILLPFYILYLIISPKARKRFLRDMVMVASYVLMFYFIQRIMQSIANNNENPSSQSGIRQPGQLLTGPLVRFEGTAPGWFTIVISLIFCALILGIVSFIIWMIWRTTRPETSPIKKQIAQQAQISLDAIRAGRDFKNIIIQCYMEMSRILYLERGIYRSDVMTPREFEKTLDQIGIPHDSIHQLTLLFEDVRYGNIIPGQVEEKRALDSLSAIVQATRSSV